MLFITYTEGTTPVFDTHTVQYHLFADDAQSLSSISGFVPSLSSCVTDLAHSYASPGLQFNPSKTEFIWFDTRHILAKLPTECCSLTICSSQSFSALMSSVISVKSTALKKIYPYDDVGEGHTPMSPPYLCHCVSTHLRTACHFSV